jgi:hypothetical protein
MGLASTPMGVSSDQLLQVCPVTKAPCDASHMESLIATVVDRTVRTTLLQLGLDIQEPIEIQRDMQYLRGWRQNAQAVRGKMSAGVISALVTASLVLGVLGFKSWIESWHHPVSFPATSAQGQR